jgi:hypothetical protein
MHDLSSMIADLREAIGDMPVSASIFHDNGGKTNLSTCAVSDLQGSDRMIEDEGIMFEADISVTYAAPDVSQAIKVGNGISVRGKMYNIIRIRKDRSAGVAVVLDCKERR